MENIYPMKQCKESEKRYLLDVESTWKSQKMLSEHCSIIENYIQSTPVKDMVVKVEPCRIVGIHAMKSFSTVDSVEKTSSVVQGSDCDVVYSLSCRNTWESEIMLSHSAFMIKDNTVSIPQKNAKMKCSPDRYQGIAEERTILPLTDIKDENLIGKKADVFCRKLSDLLSDENEKEVECNESVKQFNQQRNLNSGIKKGKNGKKYECDQCGKKFSQKGHLNVHNTTHTGIKKYEWENQGKYFKKMTFWPTCRKHPM